MYEFWYSGGVYKRDYHTNEKFLLFFVVGGKEVPFYQMQRDNLIVQMVSTEPRFSTANRIVKVFLGQSGFGVAKRYYSFYMQFRDGPGPLITVRPFSGDETDYVFKGNVHFLRKSQILKILPPDAPSRQFVTRQVTPPVDILRSLVTVDRSAVKKGIRKVRIARNGE